MKKIEWNSVDLNGFVNVLLSALLQIFIFLFFILILEFLLINLQLSPATPKKIIYIEAFIFFLISKLAKIIVDTFKKDD